MPFLRELASNLRDDLYSFVMSVITVLMLAIGAIMFFIAGAIWMSIFLLAITAIFIAISIGVGHKYRLKVNSSIATVTQCIHVAESDRGIGVNQDWVAHAYPLKQISITIQGTKHSSRESMILQLDEIKARLENGDEAGSHHDDDFGYEFKSSETQQSAFSDNSTFR